MRNALLPLIALILLAGCGPRKAAPRPEIPHSWAQKSEERGQLEVGRVIAVQRVSVPAMSEGDSTGSEIARGLAGMVIVPLALLTAPIWVLAQPDEDKHAGENRQGEPEGTGNVFRHRVRLEGTRTEVIRNEYFHYQVGDCVALRTQPLLLVPALPGECG